MSIGTWMSAGMLVAAAGSTHFDATLPEVASPPLGEARWVAEHMKLNGLPMSLKTFVSPLDVDELFRHYEAWAREHDIRDSQRSRRNDLHVLALRSTRHFISIQARQTLRGLEGTIAVSPLPDAMPLSVATSFPHPTNARVVNLQQYRDDGFESEHISMVSLRSAAVEARAFAELLSRHGWQLLRNGPASTSIRSHIIEAQRGGEHAMVTFHPDRTRQAATAIVIVWKKP